MNKQKAISRLLAFAICVVMVFGLVPFTAFAAIDNYNANYESATHTVFKHTEQTLAPGVTQYTNYAYTTADNQQMVYYVTTADVNRDDVMMQISYKGMQHDVYGMEKLADTVATANDKYSNPSDEDFISEYYTVVSAVNGNGYNMTTGKPSGVWAMGGEVITDYTGGSCYLAIDGTGKAVMGKTVQEWNDLKAGAGVQEAINCFGSILVWDGAIQITQTSSYYSDRASRTMVGITEDGKVVCCVVDGRQPPFSCGASMLELAHIMLEAGCKYAMNLDGGGSTTYMAKNEGSDKCTVNNRPSDGSERAISNGILIVSLAAPSNVFDHVSMEVADQYVTVGASTEVSVVGVSPAGTSATIPEEITYEATNGTYENGVFTASALGTATVTAKLGGNAVGSVDINVVMPTSISFVNSTMTVPFGKTVNINIEAKYNLSDLKYCADNFAMTLSDNSIGTIDGLKFTASDGTGATESKLTVECGSLSAECTIKLGKGSEVLFDFEDDSQADVFTIYEWPNYNKSNVGGKMEIATAETGKVRRGNQSLAITADFTQLVDSTNGGEANKQGGADYVELNLQMKSDYWSEYNLKGATAVGFWIYIPDEMDVTCVYPRVCFDWSNDGVTWTKGQRITAWMTAPNRPAGDNAHLDDYGEGWVYFSVNTSSFAGKNYIKFGSESNYFIEFYVEEGGWKKDDAAGYSKMTFYLDDITVDYSTAVDDREAPVFSNFTYAAEGIFDAIALNNNAVLTKNSKYDFNVRVVENTAKDNFTGLNLNSFKAYVDGVEKSCTFTNGNLAVSDVVLNDGAHTVKFYAEDNLGNSSYIVRNFTINANSDYVTTSLVAHDDTITSVLCGSLYYVDLKVSDIAKVNSFKTVLKVVNTNDWEPQGIVVADGFSYTYSLDTVTGRLTLNVEKAGEVEAAGEAVLASIPVRAWYEHDSIGGDWITPAEASMRRFAWPKRIQIASKFGEMETTEGTLSFSYDEFLIDTEMMPVAGAKGYPLANGNSTVHSHTAEAIEDLAPTCTETGYTGRTYCAVCDSIVDWGTVVPATGHTYDFVDGVLQCACGDLFNGEYQGVYYTNGLPENGWAGNSYYVDGVKLTGINLIDGYYYDFGEDGVCENKTKYTGLFYDEENGVYRYSPICE